MDGKEVQELPIWEMQEDKLRSESYIRLKYSFFNLAFHSLEAAFLRGTADDSPVFSFIPFPCGPFVDMLIEAATFFKFDKSKKFLDVGCGPGTKLLLAKGYFDVYGIDINQHFVGIANSFGLPNAVIANALYYDYSAYDLVYYYRPFKDLSLLQGMEERIYSQLRVGTLLAPMHSVIKWDDYPDMEKVSKFLYLKVQ